MLGAKATRRKHGTRDKLYIQHRTWRQSGLPWPVLTSPSHRGPGHAPTRARNETRERRALHTALARQRAGNAYLDRGEHDGRVTSPADEARRFKRGMRRAWPGAAMATTVQPVGNLARSAARGRVVMHGRDLASFLARRGDLMW